MNMQKNQYTKQFFSHCPKTKCVASLLAVAEHRTHGLHKFCRTPEKARKLIEKFELLEKE